MRIHRSLLPSSLLVLLLLLTSVGTARSSTVTVSRAITADALVTDNGSMIGDPAALEVFDQHGTEDAPSQYVSFSTPDSLYFGYQVFHLPPDAQPSRVTALLLQVNFKSPPTDPQTWTWSVYSWDSQLWHEVGSTVGAEGGKWTTLTFRIRSVSRYISPSREMRILFRSSDSSEDIKLDYEALHVTYIPIAPTATRGVPTSIPTKGAFVLPTTVTPSPTNTPTITPSPTETPTPTNTPIASNTPTCFTPNSAFEAQVLTLLNQERTSRGIPALAANSKLQSAARRHSQDMACHNFMSHTGSDGSGPGDRITDAGYDFSTWGENVAAGYTSPSSVVNGWMDSPGHRANILDPDFKEIGIGYAYNSNTLYKHYWTTDFGAP